MSRFCNQDHLSRNLILIWSSYDPCKSKTGLWEPLLQSESSFKYNPHIWTYASNLSHHESHFCNQNRLSTNIILTYEPYESNLWVTFEDQPAKTGGCLIAQDFLNPLKTTFESLCSQHLLKHLKKNKSRLHLDGSHLRSQPWEHHHLRCHQLRPGMGGDLHEYLPYNLSNPKSKQPLWFISLQCVC